MSIIIFDPEFSTLTLFPSPPHTVSPNPAPNCYSVERGQTHRGQFTGPAASMKGRPTPALYSGFPSSHMARLQSFST